MSLRATTRNPVLAYHWIPDQVRDDKLRVLDDKLRVLDDSTFILAETINWRTL